MKKLFLLITIMALHGCYTAEYEDISYDERYAGLIGKKYKSVDELLIYGITADKNYKKEIDYYVVMNKPGIGGREVVTQAKLPKGTYIQIKKVKECTNCLYSSAFLIISILSDQNYDDFEINLRGVGDKNIFEYMSEGALLNTKMFLHIEN